MSLNDDLQFIEKKFNGQPKTEREIKWAVRYVLGRFDEVSLWDNDVGLGEIQGRPIHFGLCVGSSDLIGLIKPRGRFIALEVKTARGKPTTEQRHFLQLVRNYGGIAEVVRSVQDAVSVVMREITL